MTFKQNAQREHHAGEAEESQSSNVNSNAARSRTNASDRLYHLRQRYMIKKTKYLTINETKKYSD